MGLTRLALNRPIFMLMLMILAVLMGMISYSSMRKEEQPEVNFGTVTVTTVYPGAGPDEVNTLVTRKVEESISGVEGLEELTSTSQEGVSFVMARFKLETNMDVALNDVRAKVDAIVGRLPEDILKPTIGKFDNTSEPVLYMVLKGGRLNSRELRDLADDKLADRFARIGGVAQVSVSGGEVREIQVQVKKDKLLSLGIGIVDVQRAIGSASLNVPSGHMESGGREFAVRVLGEYRSLEDIENTALSLRDQNQQGGRPTVVKLKDVADIQDATAERRSWSRLDGSEAVVLTVAKTRDGNAMQISEDAHKVMTGIERDYGIKSIVTSDASERIGESLFDMISALMIGVVLVSLIVYVFLHNFRGTMIVAIAIPICIFSAFIALSALGFTINMMSMLALSLAIGVLVDDAIVVLENIYRHLKMGEDPVTAAINGRSEIGLAAIAITLADVVVFVPIATMGGVVGQFFKPLGIAFVAAVLLSLFVSFTITPMLAARWYRAGEDVEHPTGWFASRFERGFEALKAFYRRALAWSIAHRWFVFITGFVALFSVFMFIGGSFAQDVGGAFTTGFGPMQFAVVVGIVVFAINAFRRTIKPRLILNAALFGLAFPIAAIAGFYYGQWKGEAVFKFAFFPPSDSGSVGVSLVLPPGTTLEKTQDVVRRVEDTVRKHPDVKYVLSDVGERGGGWSGSETGTNYGQVRITLNDKQSPLDQMLFWVPKREKLRTRSDMSVAADMLQSLGRIPGVEMTVNAGEGVGFGAPIQMSFTSEDRDLLQQTASRIVDGLKSGAIKGVVSPEMSSKPGKPELRAIPDRTKLADVGMTSAEVAGTMRVLYEGNNDAKFRVRGREYDIRVMMDMRDRNDPKIVEQLPLTFVEGAPVYLSQVARMEPGVGVDQITRRDRIEEIKIDADLLPGFAAGTVQLEIDKWLQKEKLIPEGVRLKPLGQADVQNREQGYLFGAILIALVLVYMLLASLYNNLLYPFIIQLAQPQAMVGALLALMISDKTLNIVGMVGIITLVGLMGKNAILLVDYTNTLRSRGYSRLDALLESGPTRLRPILMTTLALILGMLPVALALGRGSEFRETIGITIIGGMTLSTLLTLLVIPCSYTIFDDLSQWWSGKMARWRRSAARPTREERPAPPTAEPEPQPGVPVQGE